MNANDVENTADEAIGPMDSNLDSKGSAVADFNGSTIATIWSGQKQLRQRILTADSSGASLRNMIRSASCDARIA